jgi:hypothetical protein
VAARLATAASQPSFGFAVLWSEPMGMPDASASYHAAARAVGLTSARSDRTTMLVLKRNGFHLEQVSVAGDDVLPGSVLERPHA